MKRDTARIVGAMAAVVFVQALAASPVIAQDESSCVCIVDIGTVGEVTKASGWVKLNGDVGLVDATEAAPLSLGSVLKTGAAGSASATVGAGCNVDVAALTEMSITKLDDTRMCVRLTSDKAVVVPDATVAVGATVLATTLVVVGLGQDDPVSK